jgi:cysteine desulfurase/selenocysteine lyase
VDTHKRDFGVLNHHPNLVYLDSCATTLKPVQMLDKMNEYYNEYGVNIHRGVYYLSYKATEEFENARTAVANFINASVEEIVFTKGTTSALNLVASSFGMNLIQEDDEIITSELEHHSSLLPWMHVAKTKKARLVYVPLDQEGRITIDNLKKVITKKTKIIALTYISNVLGYITPIKEIISYAKELGIITVVDAAQAAPHIKIDVKALDCDFLAFSAHKMLGPTGLGILYGKYQLLKDMEPIDFGGDMNDNVNKYDVVYKDAPFRFEGGTPPIAEAVAFQASLQYLESVGLDQIHTHSNQLAKKAIKGLLKIEGVTVYNPTTEAGVIAFNIDGVHPHDAVSIYDEDNIALRAGHHCAQLVSKWLNCVGTLRASFYIYNTIEDVNRFLETTVKVRDFFRQF